MLSLSINVFSTEVLIEDTIFVSYWRRSGHFMCSSKPCEGLVLQREYLHFSLFLVSSGLAWEPATSHSRSSTLPTELILSVSSTCNNCTCRALGCEYYWYNWYHHIFFGWNIILIFAVHRNFLEYSVCLIESKNI